MRTKPFSELRKRMTPERREKIETRVQLALLQMNLMELQTSLGITEDNMGNNINDLQSALFDLENQDDIPVSTLSRYIKALGGSLKLVAHFPDKEVVISQFE
ncbi:MAG: transcriptional regulator [Actinomycetota bacterium]